MGGRNSDMKRWETLVVSLGGLVSSRVGMMKRHYFKLSKYLYGCEKITIINAFISVLGMIFPTLSSPACYPGYLSGAHYPEPRYVLSP